MLSAAGDIPVSPEDLDHPGVAGKADAKSNAWGSRYPNEGNPAGRRAAPASGLAEVLAASSSPAWLKKSRHLRGLERVREFATKGSERGRPGSLQGRSWDS